jgi:hypothetical protein
MPNKFDSNLRKSSFQIQSEQKESIDWFKDSIYDINKKQKGDPNKLFRKSTMPQVGDMFLFVYDPKTKDKLPFWDTYPLVFPINMYDDGFLGINLHYLPYLPRQQLLKALDGIKNNNKYNDSTKLTISYEVLNRYANQFKGYDVCIKRYLYGHVRSSFHYVMPSDWGKVIMLPLQRWKINPNRRLAGTPPY